jgi:hypothetical protein
MEGDAAFDLGLSQASFVLLTSTEPAVPPFGLPSHLCFTLACFMLGEYKVGRCTRQCHALKRPLREGEYYYSVVIESGDEYLRHDYSAESWKGPPEGAVGWWKSRMPTSGDKKMVLAPPEVLIDLLRQMEQFPGKAKSRYLLALMLMRRKLVRPVTSRGELDSEEEVLRLEVVQDGSTVDVPICKVARSESESLRDELNELLYCEAEQGLNADLED